MSDEELCDLVRGLGAHTRLIRLPGGPVQVVKTFKLTEDPAPFFARLGREIDLEAATIEVARRGPGEIPTVYVTTELT